MDDWMNVISKRELSQEDILKLSARRAKRKMKRQAKKPMAAGKMKNPKKANENRSLNTNAILQQATNTAQNAANAAKVQQLQQTLGPAPSQPVTAETAPSPPTLPPTAQSVQGAPNLPPVQQPAKKLVPRQQSPLKRKIAQNTATQPAPAPKPAQPANVPTPAPVESTSTPLPPQTPKESKSTPLPKSANAQKTKQALDQAEKLIGEAEEYAKQGDTENSGFRARQARQLVGAVKNLKA